MIENENKIMQNEIGELLDEIKLLAKKYKRLTGKPLGVTGEVGEFAAAKILGLELSDARQPGYDAIKEINGKKVKYQIKSRSIKTEKLTGRIGAIKFEYDFDYVLFVMMDEDLEVVSIHQAERSRVKEELEKPGSISRNKRHQLSIRKFISFSEEIWNNQN
jgi:hypothetical protein